MTNTTIKPDTKLAVAIVCGTLMGGHCSTCHDLPYGVKVVPTLNAPAFKEGHQFIEGFMGLAIACSPAGQQMVTAARLRF